jgi:hypothetical protein
MVQFVFDYIHVFFRVEECYPRFVEGKWEGGGNSGPIRVLFMYFLRKFEYFEGLVALPLPIISLAWLKGGIQILNYIKSSSLIRIRTKSFRINNTALNGSFPRVTSRPQRIRK